MTKGANWDEDTSSGDYPNNYHFFTQNVQPLHQACLFRSMSRESHYKREEDGVVLIDDDKCQESENAIKHVHTIRFILITSRVSHKMYILLSKTRRGRCSSMRKAVPRKIKVCWVSGR